MRAIPLELKKAIAIGIGLFIAFIGLYDSGLVVQGQGTPVTLGHWTTWPVFVTLLGLVLTLALRARGFRGDLLVGILGTTIVATIINEAKDKTVFPNGSATWPSKIFDAPHFGLVGNFSLHFVSALGFWSALAVVVSVLLSDFFDTAGTVLGLGRRAGLVESDGRLPGMRRVLIVDSLAAAAGGAASASSNTTFIESSAGIGEGGRTGLASVVTGLLFACCLFISPLAGIIPSAATAPVLVIVGAMMFELVRHLEWRDPVIALPVLLTIVLMPMTYSITNGVGAGFVSYSALTLLAGRRVHPLMLVISAVFVWYFVHGVVG
jgi:AGZA family xanthine/uracil permease-like MFS transporter